MMDGHALGHNCFRPHMAPGGKTLAEVAGIVIWGRDKCKTAIRTAARRTGSGEEAKRCEVDGDRMAPLAR